MAVLGRRSGVRGVRGRVGFASAVAADAAATPVKGSTRAVVRAGKRGEKLKAPKRKGAARISGALENGQTVTVATGTWKGTPPCHSATSGRRVTPPLQLL